MALYLMLRWFEYHQVYHPSRNMENTGLELGRPREDLYFTTDDGVKLNAWFYPAPANHTKRQEVFLLCHGNAGNISHRLTQYAALLELGVAVLAFDYRGYGRSEGRPSEAGTYADAQAAWRWLRDQGVPPSKIIVLGESLGGGIAAELARRETVGGLVLMSSFTSVADVGSELFPWLPVRWINRIKYDIHGKLPQIQAPVLIMHSRGDALMPFHHAERNYAAANEPKLFWELAGDHNDILLTDRKKFTTGIEAFLRLLP
jgi:uncharacterized protein